MNGPRPSNVEDLVAIDVHTHAEVVLQGPPRPWTTTCTTPPSTYFKVEGKRKPTLQETAAYYRERKMAAVIFTVDAESATGTGACPNEEVAEAAAANADVLIPFASIDPFRGRAGVRAGPPPGRGVRGAGLQVPPQHPGLLPQRPRGRYPLYEVIEETGTIALFHTGQTGIGAGVPGGGGIRLKYSNPLHVDDVAADFPDLKIILAHPSFPWQDEALAVATHKPGVHIDLSGWSPKYFPPQLVQYANTLLKDKVLFGSDFPVLTPDRWLADFEKLAIKDEVRPKILKENAARLLGLTEPRPDA